MYLIKIVLKSIKNNRSKYLILFFLLLFINIFIFTFGKAYQYDSLQIENINKQYGSDVTIDISPSYNLNNIGENQIAFSDFNFLSYEDYEKISESRFVKNTNYEQTIYVTVEDLNIQFPKIALLYGNNRFFEVVGNNSLEEMTSFKIGDKKLVEGTFPKNDLEVMISQDMAESSGLEIGDRINLKTESSEIFSFKIVGLFSELNAEDEYTIYTTYDTTQLISNNKNNITAIYKLYSYKDSKAFENELYNNGLSKIYYVNNNEYIIAGKTEEYYNRLSTITTVENFTLIAFLIAIVIISSSILERKKNTLKVSRLLGVSKIRLILISLFEVFIVTFLSLLIISGIIIILNIWLLQNIGLNIPAYYSVLRNMFLTNLIIFALANFETILFINSYHISETVSEGKSYSPIFSNKKKEE